MEPAQRMMVYTSKGRKIMLTYMNKKGGVGYLYQTPADVVLPSGQRLVAKIYIKPPSTETITKLKSMVGFVARHINEKDNNLLDWTAFPCSILSDKEGNFKGYLMPSFLEYSALEEFINPKSLAEIAELPCFTTVLHVAKNLARTVSVMHAYSIIYGDFNPKNFLAHPEKCNVAAIDMDSVQLKGSDGTHFHIEAMHPSYRSPEFCYPRLGETVFNVDHDNYCLATHIFRLLCFGVDPTACRDLDPHRDLTTLDKISGRFYPYNSSHARKLNIEVPRIALMDPEFIYPPLVDMFERAFLPNKQTPSASEWYSFLKSMAEAFQICSKNSDHSHMKGGMCSFCTIENAINASSQTHIKFRFYDFSEY